MRQTRHKKACGAGFGGPHRSNAAERDTDDALEELHIYSVQVRRSKDQRDEVSSPFSSAVSVSQAITKRPHQERHWYRYLARPQLHSAIRTTSIQPPAQHHLKMGRDPLIGLVGKPSSGKSTTLNSLTDATSKVGVSFHLAGAQLALTALLPYALADAAFQETFREDSSTPRPRFGLRSGMR